MQTEILLWKSNVNYNGAITTADTDYDRLIAVRLKLRVPRRRA